MLSTLRKTIRKHRMLAQGDHVLAAVSGGADSVALLSVLCRLRPAFGITLSAAHFNHRTRGAESDRDEAFVRDLCASFQVELIAGSLKTKTRPRGQSTEDYLRRERYAFLEEARTQAGADRVALGHHRGDQAETVLMNILRGAGVSGLSGIPAVRDGGRFIRPLIDCSRRDITGYLEREGLSFVEDRSNRDDRFLRNRIRSGLMPVLEQRYNPAVEESLCRLADVFRQENDYMTVETRGHLSKWREAPSRTDRLEIPIAEFGALHEALQRRAVLEITREWAAPGSAIGFEHVQSVLDLAARRTSQGSLDLPGGLVVRRSYGLLEFCRADRAGGPARGRREPDNGSASFRIDVPVPGTVRVDGLGVGFRFRELRRAPADPAAKSRAYMDMERICGSLVLRSIEPGDRIQPLGMTGTRKLKSILIDEKVPREMRGRIAVLADEESVLWVPGLRLSERVRVGKRTRRVLSAEII